MCASEILHSFSLGIQVDCGVHFFSKIAWGQTILGSEDCNVPIFSELLQLNESAHYCDPHELTMTFEGLNCGFIIFSKSNLDNCHIWQSNSWRWWSLQWMGVVYCVRSYLLFNY